MFKYGYYPATFEDYKEIRSRRRCKSLAKGDKVVGMDFMPYGIRDGIVGGTVACWTGAFVTIDYSKGNTFHQIDIPYNDVRKLKKGEEFA